MDRRRGARLLVLSVAASAHAACFFSPSLKSGGDEGEGCDPGSPCHEGLVCEISVCQMPDDASNPRVFGDFEALYDPDLPTSRLLLPGPQSFRMLDDGRLLTTTSVIDLESGPTGVTWSGLGVTAPIALTDDEAWGLVVTGGSRGLSLADLTSITTGMMPGTPAGDRLAGNETGDLAWWANDGTGIYVLGPDRDAPPTVTPASNFSASMVIEPGGEIVYAGDGQLQGPTGRPVGTHPEWVMAVHRPIGGPTIAAVRTDVNQSPPTRLVILEPDGRFTALVTLPDELYVAPYLDVHDGHLYLSTDRGLFRSRSAVLP